MWAMGPKGVTHLRPLHSTDFSLLGCLILFPFLLILFIPFYIETLGLNCFQLFNIKIIQIRTLFVVQDSCLSRVFLPVLRVHQSPLVPCSNLFPLLPPRSPQNFLFTLIGFVSGGLLCYRIPIMLGH